MSRFSSFDVFFDGTFDSRKSQALQSFVWDVKGPPSPVASFPTMIVVHWSRDGSSVYLSPGLMMLTYFLSPGLMMLAWQWVAARSRAVITRCIVPFAVPLAARRGHSVLGLLSLLLSRSIVRLRVCGAVAFSCGCNVTRALSRGTGPETRLSVRSLCLQRSGGIEFVGLVCLR